MANDISIQQIDYGNIYYHSFHNFTSNEREVNCAIVEGITLVAIIENIHRQKSIDINWIMFFLYFIMELCGIN